jgi:hypothetical protein
MRPLSRFLKDELGVAIDGEMYQDLLDEVKTWGLNKPAGRVTWSQFNSAVLWLNGKCPWIRGRIPRDPRYESIRRKFKGTGIPFDEF